MCPKATLMQTSWHAVKQCNACRIRFLSQSLYKCVYKHTHIRQKSLIRYVFHTYVIFWNMFMCVESVRESWYIGVVITYLLGPS
jgi:hypothetical protein